MLPTLDSFEFRAFLPGARLGGWTYPTSQWVWVLDLKGADGGGVWKHTM
jgi:hypothetical protein